MLIFSFVITIGFIFELGKGALKISKQLDNFTSYKNPITGVDYIGKLTFSQNNPKFYNSKSYSDFSFYNRESYNYGDRDRDRK